MSIDYLKAVISPPQNVVDRPSEGDWAGVEARLGTVLPDDYKDFAGIWFGEYWSVLVDI